MPLTGSAGPVNVASRITAVARPGTVLVAESARDAIGSTFRNGHPRAHVTSEAQAVI